MALGIGAVSIAGISSSYAYGSAPEASTVTISHEPLVKEGSMSPTLWTSVVSKAVVYGKEAYKAHGNALNQVTHLASLAAGGIVDPSEAKKVEVIFDK